jgi:transcription elongation factor GreB
VSLSLIGYNKALKAMAKNYLSAEAFRKMKEELTDLLDKQRPVVVVQVREAAALGDRSENAEYIYGKKRLREIDRRVRFLQKRLEDVEVIAQDEVHTEEVRFGVWVKLNSSLGTEKLLQIVGPDEVDSSGTKISFHSPLGKALLGKKPKDEVKIQSPRGEITYKVVSLHRELEE